jgi:hypothetical protein
VFNDLLSLISKLLPSSPKSREKHSVLVIECFEAGSEGNIGREKC